MGGPLTHSEESSLPEEFNHSIQYHWLGDKRGFCRRSQLDIYPCDWSSLYR